MRRLLAVAFLFLPAVVAAQQPPRYGAAIEIKLIEIDVVVTDRDGNPVQGLTPDDFELFEGRSRREITNFTEYRSAAVVAEPAGASQSFPVPEPRTVVVLIDSLPRTGLVRQSLFRSLEPALAKIVRDGDRATVIFWDPGLARAETLVDLSTDAGEVLNAVRRLAQRVVAADPAAAGAADAKATRDFFEDAAQEAQSSGASFDFAGNMDASGRFRGEVELMRLRRKARMMRRVITSLAASRGRKAFLYVSQDLPFPSGGSERLSAIGMLDDIARDANAAGVAFYAVRPHVPNPQDEGAEAREAPDDLTSGVSHFQNQMEALQRVSDATGGLTDFGLQSLDTLGERMATDLNSYYSLAYRARSDGRDRERRINVRTKNPQYKVRSRKAFVDKSDETIARETLLARLFSDTGGDDLAFEVIQGDPRRSGRKRWLLPLVLKIPTAQLQFERDIANVKILIVAGNGLSEVTEVTEDDLRIVSGRDTKSGFITYSVQILADERGSELSIGVFDERSGLIGVRTLDNRGRLWSDRRE